MRNLYLAYVVTWLIHGLYLIALARGFARVRREFDDLKKE